MWHYFVGSNVNTGYSYQYKGWPSIVRLESEALPYYHVPSVVPMSYFEEDKATGYYVEHSVTMTWKYLPVRTSVLTGRFQSHHVCEPWTTLLTLLIRQKLHVDSSHLLESEVALNCSLKVKYESFPISSHPRRTPLFGLHVVIYVSCHIYKLWKKLLVKNRNIFHHLQALGYLCSLIYTVWDETSYDQIKRWMWQTRLYSKLFRLEETFSKLHFFLLGSSSISFTFIYNGAIIS